MNNVDLIRFLRAKSSEWRECAVLSLHRMRMLNREHYTIVEAIRYTEDDIDRREIILDELEENLEQKSSPEEEKLPPGVSKVNGYYVMTPTAEILKHANDRINAWRSIALNGLNDTADVLEGRCNVVEILRVLYCKVVTALEEDALYRAHVEGVRIESLQKPLNQKRHPHN